MIAVLDLEGGKYRVNFSSDPWLFKAYRGGEQWRDLTGDKLMLAMFHRILEVEAENQKLKGERT